MPLSLAKLVANRAHAAVDFGDGDVLHVDYYPAKITGDMLANLADLDDVSGLSSARAVELMRSASDILLSLVASWDLVDEDGEPIPLDHEHVDALGLPIQWAIVMGVMRAGGSGQGEAPAPGGSPKRQRSGATS